jgi:hypothetical protein
MTAALLPIIKGLRAEATALIIEADGFESARERQCGTVKAERLELAEMLTRAAANAKFVAAKQLADEVQRQLEGIGNG